MMQPIASTTWIDIETIVIDNLGCSIRIDHFNQMLNLNLGALGALLLDVHS